MVPFRFLGVWWVTIFVDPDHITLGPFNTFDAALDAAGD